MANHISDADIKQAIGSFPTWWASKTAEEKAWYIKFWAHCSRL